MFTRRWTRVTGNDRHTRLTVSLRKHTYTLIQQSHTDTCCAIQFLNVRKELPRRVIMILLYFLVLFGYSKTLTSDLMYRSIFNDNFS